MVKLLPPNTITQLHSPRGLYEKGIKGNIELPKAGRVCYALAPKCDFRCDTTVPGQPWHDSAHSKNAHIPAKATLVWLFIYFFFPLHGHCGVMAVGKTGLKAKMTPPGWSGEAGFESSWRVVTRSGTNRWVWGSSGQAPTPLMVWRGFPEFGLASRQEPLLPAACFCHVSKPSLRIQQHENITVNMRHYKST